MKKVWIQDHWHIVEFESLNLICATCDHFMHVARDCKVQATMAGGKGKDSLASIPI